MILSLPSEGHPYGMKDLCLWDFIFLSNTKHIKHRETLLIGFVLITLLGIIQSGAMSLSFASKLCLLTFGQSKFVELLMSDLELRLMFGSSPNSCRIGPSTCAPTDLESVLQNRSCTDACERTGQISNVQLPSCSTPSDGVNPNYERRLRFALSQVFEDWNCSSECRYQCMKDTESKREALREAPMKYYGKWPFTRYLNLQEPASVFFSILNLIAHLQGLLSYYRLVHYNLPQRKFPGGKAPYYEYTGLWLVYGVFAINSWIWSAFFHARDITVTERLDYSSAVALLGYTLILTIIRTGNLRIEAAQVMVAAPIIAFISTHIMYLNFYLFDYGLNMKVCITMGVAQLLLWTGWAGITHHPARFKLWLTVLGTVLAMLLEIFDFPPMWGILDAHSLWHACTVPITVLWWSFIRDDVRLRTHSQVSRFDRDARKVQ